MRIDIAKNDALPGYRRAEGKRYQMFGYLDPKPMSKFYSELITKAELENGKP